MRWKRDNFFLTAISLLPFPGIVTFLAACRQSFIGLRISLYGIGIKADIGDISQNIGWLDLARHVPDRNHLVIIIDIYPQNTFYSPEIIGNQLSANRAFLDTCFDPHDRLIPARLTIRAQGRQQETK